MIALAQEADEEYGRLLKEGLHNAKKIPLHQNHLAISMVIKHLKMP